MGSYLDLPRAQRAPDYLEQSPESLALLRAITERAMLCREAALDTGAQLRVNTATWGLDLWEELAGIEPDGSLSDAERRRAVTARLEGAGVCTPAVIARIARTVTGYEGLVTEQTARYTFTLRFAGDEPGFAVLPLPALRAAVEEVKPAHLKFVIASVTWGDLAEAALSWGGLPGTFPVWRSFETTSVITKKEDS